MKQSSMGLAVALVMIGTATPDISGTWTAEFETQIGHQAYVYQFQLKGRALTGTVSSASGEAAIQQGKVRGTVVTFLETLMSQGRPMPVVYSGTIVSADEIRFVRRIGEIDTEEFVAFRVQPQLRVARWLERTLAMVNAKWAGDRAGSMAGRRGGRSPASRGLRARAV